MAFTRREVLKRTLLFGGSLILAPIPLTAGVRKEGPWYPAYYHLENEGKLKRRIEDAYAHFEACELCPRQCGIDRSQGERGFCRAPMKVIIFSAHPHFGEELSLVGRGGSGTVFFSNCNLRCVFCQNWPIAHEGKGRGYADEELANIMLNLQKIGCHNINLVTPTHVMPNILRATRIALHRGLRLPLVYNTSGYERVEILKLLDGIVDIYLPDMKYMHPEKAGVYSPGASDYPEVAKQAVVEMNRQVGGHLADDRGVALRGLMIRHLVMPNRVAGTREFVRWAARNLPKNTYINIMPQYRVEYRAFEYPEIARGITAEEFLEAMAWAEETGLTNLDPRSMLVRKFYEQRK